MDTVINHDNPFGWNRHGFLFEVLRTRSRKPRHLDYGAYDGAVLCELSRVGVIESGVGLDVNLLALDARGSDIPDNIELAVVATKPKISISFEDESFDTASVLDVIEHIVDQEAILKEIRRVLRPGGDMVITVPKNYVLSWLDTGNFKFRFPFLHRKFYEFWYSKAAYRKRYVECKDGLFGDIEMEKKWHQHFSEQEMRDLLEKCGFEVVGFDGSGCFLRIFGILRFFMPFLRAPINWIISWDERYFKSCGLFCVARKPT